MNLRRLDIVILKEDRPTHGLKRGPWAPSSRSTLPDAVEVESVMASGRTKALVTLPPSALREDSMDHSQARAAQLELIDSVMGQWLAGLLQGLAGSPEWHAKIAAERASDLRFAVVSRLGTLSKEHDAIFRAYFHDSGGSWEELMTYITVAHHIQ